MSTFTILLRYLRPHRALILLLACVLLGTTALQIVSPFLAARFIDRATAATPLRGLIAIAVATIVLALLAQILTIVETWAAERVSWAATNALRLDLAAHILRLDYTFHSQHAQGELIERVDGDVGALARFFSRFVLNVVGSVILLLGILGAIWVIDWRIGLGMTIVIGVALVAMLRIRTIATPLWMQERQTNADVYGFLGEYLAGLEDIRASGPRADRFVIRRFREMLRGWLRISIRANMWGYALLATSTGVFTIGVAFALGMGGWLYREGALTLGTVFLVFRLADMLRAPTEGLRDEIQDFQQADASLGRIRALLAEQPTIVDGIGTSLPNGPLAIAFDDVTFGYDPTAPILRNVTLEVAPGRVLGIVGRTGSGKSTLTRMIPRFVDPDVGTVRIGGVDLRELRLHELRDRIGVVPQDVQLFDATLRDNLTLFADPGTIPDDRLHDLLDTLGLAAWRRSLPDDLDTRLGAGGVGLSAGQTQVLSCARILLRDPDIVLLDEASARLDAATERLVHDALTRLLAGRTGIIVAHRLETLTFADDIAVLVDGELVEHGPRTDLIGDPTSRFATLLRTQTEEALR